MSFEESDGPTLSVMFKDESRIDYLSLLKVFSGPGSMEISSQSSQELYVSAYSRSKQATTFSNRTKASVSTVIKAFDIGIENETTYANSFESENALHEITNHSSFESLKTNQQLGDNTYGVVLCKTAMLNTSNGVLHVPVEIHNDVLSKSDIESLCRKNFVDDSWATPLGKYDLATKNLKTLKQLNALCKSMTTESKVKVNRNLYVKDIYAGIKDEYGYTHKNMVREYFGKNCDVNSGFGGCYTYVMRVEPTEDASQAATGFKLVRSKNEKKGYGHDYAAKTGGDYRYIISVRDGQRPVEWDNVKLFRGERSVPSGWEKTHDLNEGRGGDYLYLGWK